MVAWRSASSAAARAYVALVKGACLIVYPDARHGIDDTHKDQLNEDLPDFLEEQCKATRIAIGRRACQRSSQPTLPIHQ